MQIQDGCIVSLAFRVYDVDGTLLEESDASEPIIYVHGQGEIAPGLESALEGRRRGEHLDLTLEPEDAYGEYDPAELHAIPRSDLPADVALEIGDWLPLELEPEEGEEFAEGMDEVEVRVVALDDEAVTVDLNHPFAGKTLRFEVDVLDVAEGHNEDEE